MAIERDWEHFSFRAGNVTWRIARPKDIQAIDELLEEKDRALRIMGVLPVGRHSPRPAMMSFPTLITLVAENDQGIVVDGLFIEAVADMTKMSLREDTFAGLSDGLADDLAAWLKSRRFRLVNVVVPKRFGNRMSGRLLEMKFIPSATRFLHWFRRL